MERILSAVKRIVRRGLPQGYMQGFMRRWLPERLGGGESAAAKTYKRLMLIREFNFDDSITNTPEWLWEQPQREQMYDDVVAEYEIQDRIDSINTQLDYAQTTIQSLRDDAQHSHSNFLEWVIIVLLSFEVAVECHAVGLDAWVLDKARALVGPLDISRR